MRPPWIDGDTTAENDDIYDYGTILPVDISMVDGNMTNTSMGKVWTLRINVTNALNVGLTLNEFNLSPSAEMYIFNDAKTALKSGIKKRAFHNF